MRVILLVYRCINDTATSCVDVLETTLYFQPSSQVPAFNDTTEIFKVVVFSDHRCAVVIMLSACYLSRTPCIDSLPKPICMEDCIVTETVLNIPVLQTLNSSLQSTILCHIF